MDDQHCSNQAADLMVRRISRIDETAANVPPGFAPLRLLLRPGGLCLELTQSDLVLGRHSSADVHIALPDVSRRHCRFLFADGHWEVCDLDSLNGTYVNGERLTASVLYSGDVLRIGPLEFEVELPLGASLPGQQANDHASSSAILESIARILPRNQAGETQEYRKAS